MTELSEIPLFGFDLAVVDPPWEFELYSDKGAKKGAAAHYPTMPLAEILAIPVGNFLRGDSWVMLWVTAPQLRDGFSCLDAWGVAYCTTLIWRKVSRRGRPMMGTGYVARSMHEQVLVGKIGAPKARMAIPSIFDGFRREHSRKPDEFYDLVERFAPDAEKLDLFGRQSRPGWFVAGNEATKFDVAAE